MWKKFWCMSKWRSDLLVLSPESGYPPHKIRYDEKCKTLWLQRVFPLNSFFSVWRVFAVSTNNLTYSQPVICVSFLTAQKQLPHFYDDVPSLSFIVASSLIFKMFTSILQKRRPPDSITCPKKKPPGIIILSFFAKWTGAQSDTKLSWEKVF